jgi:hypothetical protein
MDSAFKYGTLKMVTEIYNSIEDWRLKPNAAIMSYLLSKVSQSN